MPVEPILKALDIIDDGLIIVNRDYIIEYANDPARRLLRIDQLVGKHSYEGIWGRGEIAGTSPSFMTFDTDEVASAERTFSDGTCLLVRSYPLDQQHLVLTVWDVTDYVSLERRLEESGNDPVTGLRASKHFSEELEKEFDRAKRTKSGLAFTLLEIGVSSKINEEDHEDLLKSVSEILVDTARSYDLVYRLHSDTFGIIMPHCNTDAAKKTGERILERIHNEVGQIDVSLGISGSKNAFTGRDIIRLAERALYVAKHRGGNDVVVG